MDLMMGTCCTLGYASTLDIDWLDTIPLETLGFKIWSGAKRRTLLPNSEAIVDKLVWKSCLLPACMINMIHQC